MNADDDVLKPAMGIVLKTVLTIIGTLAIMGIGISGKTLWDHEVRLTRREDFATELIQLKADAKAAIRVSEAQKIELLQLGQSIARIEQHIQTNAKLLSDQIGLNTKLLSDQIGLATEDRFRRKEWEAEKSAMEARFGEFNNRMEDMTKKLQSLIDKMP